MEIPEERDSPEITDSSGGFVLSSLLKDLKQCFKDDLLTVEEYEKQRKEILQAHLQSVTKMFSAKDMSHPNPLQSSFSPFLSPISIEERNSMDIQERVQSVPDFNREPPEDDEKRDSSLCITDHVLNETESFLSVDLNVTEDNDCNITVADVADVSKQLQQTFIDKEIPLKTLDELSVDEFWSILLQVEIPEGMFYPPPNNMNETVREPFFIPKALLSSLFEQSTEDNKIKFKEGASIVFRSFFPAIYDNKIKIPWCIKRSTISTSCTYFKADIAKINWYCPWEECEVTKTWYIYDIPTNRKLKLSQRVSKRENVEKIRILKEFLAKSSVLSNDSYVVVEVIGLQHQHHHLKGSKGGVRLHVDDELKHLDVIKHELSNRIGVVQGKMLSLFSKQVAPLIQMAQSLLNQPTESFLAGATSLIPHKLSCYQKNNSNFHKMLLQDFDIHPNDSINESLMKLMKKWVDENAKQRTEMAGKIPFDSKKCVVGYIQKLNFEKEDAFACICFSEAQLLGLLCDLQVEPAILWDGTEPNTLRDKHLQPLMFPILTRGAYIQRKTKEGKVCSTPCKVVARMFSNIKTADAQITFFQTLIDKSKYYGNKKLDLTGVILVSDMDPILHEVAAKFGMKIFWDHWHVQKSIHEKLKGKSCLNIVLHYFAEIRNCETLETAKQKTVELRDILTTQKKTLTNSATLFNPNYDPKAWKYLYKQYFTADDNYSKLCKWTVSHLDTSFWVWSQAIES